MARLVKFESTHSAEDVWVNPDEVKYVEVDVEGAKPCSTIYFKYGGYVEVEGSTEEVASKLNCKRFIELTDFGNNKVSILEEEIAALVSQEDSQYVCSLVYLKGVRHPFHCKETVEEIKLLLKNAIGGVKKR